MPAAIEAMRELELDELDIRIGSQRVSLRRFGAPVVEWPLEVAAPTELEEPVGHLVRAPLAGTFFATPKPGDPAFVQVGGHVQEGDLVGLVEAMKVFNEIVADVEGEVMRILARSGDGVSAGQPLLLVDAGDAPQAHREANT